MAKVTVTFTLDSKDHDKLVKLAEKESRSISGQVQHLVKTHPEGIR